MMRTNLQTIIIVDKKPKGSKCCNGAMGRN